MRILKVANIPNSRNTGMGRVMHNTSDELRQMGHQVDFLFSEDVPRASRGRLDRMIFPVALVKAIRQRMQQTGLYDIVEIHEPSAAWYVWSQQRDKALPACVIMSHGLEEVQWQLRRKLDRLLHQHTSMKSRITVPATLLWQARYGLKRCQQVMCLNSYDERFLSRHLRLNASHISRVQNGVDQKFFTPRDYGGTNPRRLLFVGTWLDKKGRHQLVETYVTLKREHPDLSLSLVGVGLPQEAVATWFPVDLRASINIQSHVNDQDLLGIYRDHDIFVFPSYFEPWGLVLNEAAAAGLAIVTTCAGGPADFLTEGTDALLVPPMDQKALINAVSQLLTNAELSHRLGATAQEQARRFTWQAAASSHLNAYRRATENAPHE